MRRGSGLGEDKLAVLREHDPLQEWRSLSETRFCVMCEKTIRASAIKVTRLPGGDVRVHCPTAGCPGTSTEWVRSGDPLLSEEAWKDWIAQVEEANAPGGGVERAAR